jgi:hypothetical protein
MQFAENVQANWQEEYCCIMTMPDLIQLEQPIRELKNFSGNFLNIRLTAAPSDFHLFGPQKKKKKKKHHDCKRLADEVETEVRKWLRRQSKDFHAAGFDALVKRWDMCIDVGGGYAEK